MSEGRGRGRPTTGTRVEVRIPADLLEVIDQAAIEAGTTRAVIIRRVIVRGAEHGWLG